MKDFKSLKVWNKGHNLTLMIYEITRTFPVEEIYGLKSQMRRLCFNSDQYSRGLREK